MKRAAALSLWIIRDMRSTLELKLHLQPGLPGQARVEPRGIDFYHVRVSDR